MTQLDALACLCYITYIYTCMYIGQVQEFIVVCRKSTDSFELKDYSIDLIGD